MLCHAIPVPKGGRGPPNPQICATFGLEWRAHRLASILLPYGALNHLCLDSHMASDGGPKAPLPEPHIVEVQLSDTDMGEVIPYLVVS